MNDLECGLAANWSIFRTGGFVMFNVLIPSA